MRLILVRHGETEHNRGRLTLGRADVPLNERGRAQARAVAASFTRAPEAIYTSPLSRAADVARAISSRTHVPISIEDALIEMDVGEMEHLTGRELRERHPEFLAAWLSDEGADARMPGGETLREVQERAWAALQRMRQKHGEAEVVAITHNFVISTVLCRALGLPLSSFRRVRQGLGARSIIDINVDSSRVLELNASAHLKALGLTDDQDERSARG